MVVSACGWRASHWLARCVVVLGLAGFVGHFAIGVAKDHATRLGKVYGSGATTIASDFEVFAVDDWLLLLERAGWIDVVLVL